MRCPHPLQANQIQGGDWANVLPVILWLIEKFIGFRQETQHKLRRYAHQQFAKNYALPHEGGFVEQGTDGSSEGLLGAIARYGARRKFRLKEGMQANFRRNTEESRVHAALLEYGETMRARRGLAGSASDAADDEKLAEEASSNGIGFLQSLSSGRDERQLSAFERKLVNEAKKAAAAEAALAKEMFREEGELLEGMQSVSGMGNGASKKRVGNIMSLGSDDIAAAAAQYEIDVEETRRRLMEVNSGGTGRMAMEAYKRQKVALDRQRDALQPKLNEIEGSRQEARSCLSETMESLSVRTAHIEKLQNKMEELNEAEQAAAKSGQLDDLKTLKELVHKNESLKKQIDVFKSGVKKQLAEMQGELKVLEEREKERERLVATGAEDEETMRLNQIESMHTKVMAKYERLRQLLAERNLTLSSGMRAIDDIPTRTELIQYERRFTELYQQVALKLGENKKYFDMYNTLDETHRMLQKEANLVNSITENFDEAMKTKASKEQFLEQFAGIIKGVEDSVAAKKATLKDKEERLAEEFLVVPSPIASSLEASEGILSMFRGLLSSYCV